MTTQALAQTITLRHELPLEELLRLIPDLTGSSDQRGTSQSVGLVQTDQAFWTTFTFGSVQATVLFGLIYAYFAL
jgi:hypothetical protein